MLTAAVLLLASPSWAVAERGFVRVAFDNGVSFEVPGSWICVSYPPFTKTIAQVLKSRSAIEQIKSSALFRVEKPRARSSGNRGLTLVTATLGSGADEQERLAVAENNAEYLRKYDERRREIIDNGLKRTKATLIHYTPATAGHHGDLHYIVTYEDTTLAGYPLRQSMNLEVFDLNAGLTLRAAYDKQDAEDVAKIMDAIVSSIRIKPQAEDSPTKTYRDN